MAKYISDRGKLFFICFETSAKSRSMNYEISSSNNRAIIYMKIRELADAAHVSTTTVLRFCKKMGCDGYVEFKIKLKEYLKSELIPKFQDDVEEILDFFKRMRTPLYQEKLNDASRLIANNERIIFIGVGNSGRIGEYAARYFSNLGKFSLSISDPFYPVNTKELNNTLVIAISESGETSQTIKILDRFKGVGCSTISVTNKESCTIARMTDCALTYYVSKTRNEELDYTTQVPALYIIETLGKKHKEIKI